MMKLIKLSMPVWAYRVKSWAAFTTLLMLCYLCYQNICGGITQHERDELELMIWAAMLFESSMVIGTLKPRKEG